MTIVECPICGPRSGRLWTRDGGWSVARCGGCGLLMTTPRPSAAVLDAIYASASYYESHGMGPGDEGAWIERARGILASLASRPRRVLDMGAGQGELVRAFRSLGLEADGVEPSGPGRDAARRLRGVALAPALPPRPGRYDLVTFVHSLEHLPDPVAALREVVSHLAPGGRIFVEVPHARSVEMWRPTWRRRILGLPAHLYHFVPESLARVVERAGLRVVEVRLSNPDALEWALGLRARWKGRAASGATAGEPPSAAPALPPARPASLWARSILPWIRRRFPGYQFQMVAAGPA